MEYQKPKGTADLLPGTTNLWEKVEKVAREVFDQFGYRGIRTPMFEAVSYTHLTLPTKA